MGKVMGDGGKGSTYRPVDYKRWSENWDRAFKKKEPKNEPNIQVEKENSGGTEPDAGQMRDLRTTPPVAGEREDSNRLAQE